MPKWCILVLNNMHGHIKKDKLHNHDPDKVIIYLKLLWSRVPPKETTSCKSAVQFPLCHLFPSCLKCKLSFMCSYLRALFVFVLQSVFVSDNLSIWFALGGKLAAIWSSPRGNRRPPRGAGNRTGIPSDNSNSSPAHKTAHNEEQTAGHQTA